MSGETVTPLSPRRREALQAVADGQVTHSRGEQGGEWWPTAVSGLGKSRLGAMRNEGLIEVDGDEKGAMRRPVRLTPAGEKALQGKEEAK